MRKWNTITPMRPAEKRYTDRKACEASVGVGGTKKRRPPVVKTTENHNRLDRRSAPSRKAADVVLVNHPKNG